jgi:hypothetical protein
MRYVNQLRSSLVVLSTALALTACGGPAEEGMAVEPVQLASTSKPLYTAKADPVSPAPATQEKEAMDLRVLLDAEGNQRTMAAFSYSTSLTNSATTNTANVGFTLSAGQRIVLGTCGVNGASGSGDTYLRFYHPAGYEVAVSDDACGGALSNFTYTAPVSGTYTLRAGCFSSSACSGTVGYSISGSMFSYSTSMTSSATVNTADVYVTLNAGQIITLGTCGVYGASGSGDTYLRFFNPSGYEVAGSDDAAGCGALSQFTYSVPVSGTYLLRAGCFSSSACSGTVGYLVQ